MKKSKFLTIDQRDAIKSFVVAAMTAGITTLITMLNAGAIPSHDDWKKIAIAALSAGLGYIVKNLLTNSSDHFAKPEQLQIADEGQK